MFATVLSFEMQAIIWNKVKVKIHGQLGTIVISTVPECLGIISLRTRGKIFGQSSKIIFLNFVSLAFIFPVIRILSDVRTRANNVVAN